MSSGRPLTAAFKSMTISMQSARQAVEKKFFRRLLKPQSALLIEFSVRKPIRRPTEDPMIDVSRRPEDDLDLDLSSLLHPASAFDHPRDVLNDPDLTRVEKRAILSSWASDVCAVASAPELRQAPGAK